MCAKYNEKNVDGAVGFYNWYLMFFITKFNKQEKIIDLLCKTLFLMKIKFNQIEKYNHTDEIIKFIKESSNPNEEQKIFLEIFERVCDHLSDLNLIFYQMAKNRNKKEDQIAFKEAANNYKKLKMIP